MRAARGLARLVAAAAAPATLAMVVALAAPAFALAAPRARAAAAQVLRDPLTASEADQMRATAAEPDKRVKLLLGFARDRLDRFAQARAGEMPDRRGVMYRMLREYDAILSELNDNLDDWMSGRVTGEMAGPLKLHKPLEQVIAAEREYLAALQKIPAASSPGDLASYRFELGDATDDTTDAISTARSDLADIVQREQAEKAAKEAAKKKKKHHFPL